MSLESLPPEQPIRASNAARHFLVFQFKLIMDAGRDLFFSPISFFAFLLDLVLRPKVEESYSMRLMKLGRRSDRVINLFDEYSNNGEYTIDKTVAEVETVLQKELEKEKQRRQSKV